MNKIDLYLCVSASIITTGCYAIYQIKAIGKNLDLRILFLIFYAFFFFGIIIKSLVFHDISEELLLVLYDYNIKEFIASNEFVIFYGLSITTAYFLIFNFFFWRFARRFKNSIRTVLKSRINNQGREAKLSFILLTSLFSIISLVGLVSLIGTSNLVADISAKRFNEAFSVSTYLFFKLSLFSRIFYLYGRQNFSRLGFFGLPYLVLQAVTILISSILFSNRSYLFLFVIEIILTEYIYKKEDKKKSKDSHKKRILESLARREKGRRNILLLPIISGLALLLLIITALRTAISESLEPLQIIQLAFLKILSGRYLFDVMKLGEIYNFAISSAKDLTFYSVGWIAPLLLPNHKDIGSKIGVEIFGLNTNAAGGVTPGMFGELSYDFGIILGALIIPIFCCAYWLIAQKIKPFIPTSFLPTFWVILLSKFILALNSSFGACLFSFIFDIAAIYTGYLCDKVRLSTAPQIK